MIQYRFDDNTEESRRIAKRLRKRKSKARDEADANRLARADKHINETLAAQQNREKGQ